MITDANEDYQNNVGGKATASFSNVRSQFLQNRDVIDSSLSMSASASLGTSLVTSLSTSMSASYGSQVVTPSQSAEFSSLSTSISDSLIGSANSSLSQSESFSREADSQQDDSISASISNSESREQSINDEQASYSDSIEADRHFLLNSTNRNSVIASQSFSLQKKVRVFVIHMNLALQNQLKIITIPGVYLELTAVNQEKSKLQMWLLRVNLHQRRLFRCRSLINIHNRSLTVFRLH